MSAAQHVYRHLEALPRGGCAVALSWRLLPTDRPDAPFTVERREGSAGPWVPVSAGPICEATSALDHTPRAATYAYRVREQDGTPSEIVEVDSGAPPTLIAYQAPLDPGDAVGGIALGDLENEGRIGYILRLARAGTVWIAAYAHSGAPLWEVDTRLPAVGGWDGSTLHVPILAWDLNGDGRTEVAYHSREGAAPTERYDAAAGDEALTVVDGETGDPVWRAPWPATRSRVMMTVGHLRGLNAPASVVVLDGTYGDVTLTAVDGASGQVQWRVAQSRPAGHNLDIGDIDEDGVQEVICGGVCYAGDGRVRWVAEPFGHTDISKPARIDPDRPGLQVWYAVESHNPGVYLVDQHGETLFKTSYSLSSPKIDTRGRSISKWPCGSKGTC
ncbi:MAG: hypothetical protein JXA09_06265, partial [Anaerolineae bacterium]|nr:hypothetical protein [Anaerolineae bacterium]